MDRGRGSPHRVMMLVWTFLAASEVHRDPILRIESHDGHGALVHHPQVVIPVEPYGMGVSEAIHTLANLFYEFAGGLELQQLRGGIAVQRTRGGGSRVIQYDDRAFGIDGDAENFAEVHVGRELEKVQVGVERDLRRRLRK